MKRPKPGAALAAGKKRFKDAVDRLQIDARSAIGDFEVGAVAGAQPAKLYLEADPAARFAVLERVLAQIPNDLVKVAGIEADFQIVRPFDESDTRSWHLHGLAEFAQEILDPITDGQARGSGCLAARELQHVVDDGAHAL